MAYASRAGRARVNSRFPQAQAVCDRCGIWYNRVSLQYQYEWAGTSLINLRRLVCRICLDTPQEQLRAIIVPADPVPIIDPRVETANEGRRPIVVITVAGVILIFLVDGFGNVVVDGFGNPILANPNQPGGSVPTPIPLLDNLGNPITDNFDNPILVAPGVGFDTLLPADPTRNSVQLLIPSGPGLWINATGGSPQPGQPAAVFYAPMSAFLLSGAAAQSMITYYCPVAGIVLTVQTS